MPETAAAPGSLAAALIQLQAALPRIVKDTPGQYGKYANLASIHEKVMPALAALGLAWICRPTYIGDGDERTFVLAYTLRHVASGEEENGDYPLSGMLSPQQLGSAITYARRYALCAVLGLVAADDDDDGQAATDAWRPPAHPHTRKADRHSAARSGPLPDDEFTNAPLATERGTITESQGKQLSAWFTKAGITGARDRLAYAQMRLDDPGLEASDQLSMRQAEDLIAHLKEDAR